jgi:putative endonuclease
MCSYSTESPMGPSASPTRLDNTARAIGMQLETLAATFLAGQGLTLLARNFHSRLGEIDLIMQDRETLVFVEVRYKRSNRFGLPAETVSLRKQRKLRLCAEYYLLRHDPAGRLPVRFDVIGITPTQNAPSQSCAPPDLAALQFSWLRNAF